MHVQISTEILCNPNFSADADAFAVHEMKEDNRLSCSAKDWMLQDK